MVRKLLGHNWLAALLLVAAAIGIYAPAPQEQAPQEQAPQEQAPQEQAPQEQALTALEQAMQIRVPVERAPTRWVTVQRSRWVNVPKYCGNGQVCGYTKKLEKWTEQVPVE